MSLQARLAWTSRLAAASASYMRLLKYFATVRRLTPLGVSAGVPQVVEEQLQVGRLDALAAREAAAAAVAVLRPAQSRCAPCTGSRAWS